MGDHLIIFYWRIVFYSCSNVWERTSVRRKSKYDNANAKKSRIAQLCELRRLVLQKRVSLPRIR